MMAEFSEVIKQFKRMCKAGNCSTATGCPMYPSCNIGQCRKIAFERPAEFEESVMAWAAEHPEPVYPSWADYISQLVLHDICEGTISGPETVLTYAMKTHIPADIAKKLGIEPKEG